MDKFVTRKKRERPPDELTDCNSQPGSQTELSTEAENPSVQTEVSQVAKISLKLPSDLGHLHPAQPVLPSFPKTTYLKQNRAFKSTWYSQFSFLEYSIEKDAAFCYACRLFACKNDKDKTFTETGFRNWKCALDKDKGFVKHSKTNAHVQAMSAWLDRNRRDNEDQTVVDHLANKQIEKNRYYLTAIKNVMVFLAVNELPFRGDHGVLGEDSAGIFLNFWEYTLQIDKKLKDINQSIPSNAKYTSPEIQNEIIGILAEIVLMKISNEIRLSDCGFFCLKCDETKDAAGVENLSLVVQFVKEGELVERFLGLSELEGLDANSITDKILTKLRMLNIEPKNIMSQCYDGASVMSGKRGGVQALLQERLEKVIPYVHCFNHQLHLVIVEAMHSEKHVKDFFEVCRIFHAFTRRHKVSQLYKGTHLHRLLEHRWSSHLDTVTAILKNNDSVIHVLQHFTNTESNVDLPAELCIEAAGIFSKIRSPIFWTVAELLKIILTVMKPLNSMLERKDMDIVSALELVEHTKKELEDLRRQDTFSHVWTRCKDGYVVATDEENTKRTAIPSKHLANSLIFTTTGQRESETFTEDRMRRLFFEILDVAITEMQDRFSEKNNAILRSLSCLVPRSANFLNNVRDIEPLAKVIMSDVEFMELDSEILPAKRFLEKSISEVEDIGYILKFLFKFRQAYPRLYQLYCAAATLGVSTSACEKTFSVVTRLLSPSRVSMLHKRKSDLVLLSVEKRIAKSISNEEFFQRFKLMSRRLVI